MGWSKHSEYEWLSQSVGEGNLRSGNVISRWFQRTVLSISIESMFVFFVLIFSNKWHRFHPHSNVRWCHYLLDKLVRGRNLEGSPGHWTELGSLLDGMLQYESAEDLLRRSTYFTGINDHQVLMSSAINLSPEVDRLFPSSILLSSGLWLWYRERQECA